MTEMFCLVALNIKMIKVVFCSKQRIWFQRFSMGGRVAAIKVINIFVETPKNVFRGSGTGEVAGLSTVRMVVAKDIP